MRCRKGLVVLVPCAAKTGDAVTGQPGEASALLDEVMREDGPALRRFILSRIRDASEAEDVLQDLYLRLIQNSGPVRLADSRRAYLVSMARNLIHDHHRHARVRDRALVEIGLQQHGRYAPPLQEQALQAREGQAAVSRAMDRLRPKHREIYVLSRMRGVRNSDIAGHLGISLRSVERHVSEISVYMRETLATCI
jgi:RNA polymerase sigma-70 factor (ECF subfamily)